MEMRSHSVVKPGLALQFVKGNEALGWWAGVCLLQPPPPYTTQYSLPLQTQTSGSTGETLHWFMAI